MPGENDTQNLEFARDNDDLTICFVLSQVRYDDEDEDEGPQPDPMFEQGGPLPVRLHNEFPPELASTPLEDIDSFYHNQRVSQALTHSLVQLCRRNSSSFARNASELSEWFLGESGGGGRPAGRVRCSYFQTSALS